MSEVRIIKGNSNPSIYISDGLTKRLLNSAANEDAELVYAGLATYNQYGDPFVLSQATVNSIRTI